MFIESRMRGFVLCGVAGLLLAAVAANLSAQDRKSGSGSLAIQVTGFADTNGQATIILLDTKEAFDEFDMRKDRREWKKDYRDLADLSISKSGKEMSVTHRIEDLKPGEYVALVFHDRNKNGKVDANFVGIPQEPFGMSNNFRPKLLPIPQHPTWTKLAFVVRPGKNRIEMKVQE